MYDDIFFLVLPLTHKNTNCNAVTVVTTVTAGGA